MLQVSTTSCKTRLFSRHTHTHARRHTREKPVVIPSHRPPKLKHLKDIKHIQGYFHSKRFSSVTLGLSIQCFVRCASVEDKFRFTQQQKTNKKTKNKKSAAIDNDLNGLGTNIIPITLRGVCGGGVVRGPTIGQDVASESDYDDESQSRQTGLYVRNGGRKVQPETAFHRQTSRGGTEAQTARAGQTDAKAQTETGAAEQVPTEDGKRTRTHAHEGNQPGIRNVETGHSGSGRIVHLALLASLGIVPVPVFFFFVVVQQRPFVVRRGKQFVQQLRKVDQNHDPATGHGLHRSVDEGAGARRPARHERRRRLLLQRTVDIRSRLVEQLGQHRQPQQQRRRSAVRRLGLVRRHTQHRNVRHQWRRSLLRRRRHGV
ncbi:Helix-loop-helix delilah-like protein [Daphnia magna]|uniref:Helix-loop-helix delilah-like protein n=1 Tax=Daphnia magna TaxID=35525 RepID=A0A164W2V8_9CRUS|nr:Helix-loop-helix delilah-like protein [Daphnia magna]